MRGFLVFSLVLSAFSLWAPSVWAPSWPSAWSSAPPEIAWALSKVERHEERGPEKPLEADPEIMAIHDVESSGGRDCGVGADGERTCFQILLATAELMACPESILQEKAAAASCAKRWVSKGRAICIRKGVYADAYYYNAGRCMRSKAKPTAYSMDVARAMLRYL